MLYISINKAHVFQLSLNINKKNIFIFNKKKMKIPKNFESKGLICFEEITDYSILDQNKVCLFFE
jgi:hypothetical protein